jgi:hypothetical protein
LFTDGSGETVSDLRMGNAAGVMIASIIHVLLHLKCAGVREVSQKFVVAQSAEIIRRFKTTPGLPFHWQAR